MLKKLGDRNNLILSTIIMFHKEQREIWFEWLNFQKTNDESWYLWSKRSSACVKFEITAESYNFYT